MAETGGRLPPINHTALLRDAKFAFTGKADVKKPASDQLLECGKSWQSDAIGPATAQRRTDGQAGGRASGGSAASAALRTPPPPSCY